jgi:hypothetical protein
VRITALVCLVVLAAVMASAAVAEDAAKVRLLYQFQPDQTITYEMKMSGSGTTTVTPEGADVPVATVPMELTGVMVMTQKVVQMYDDGSAAIEMLSDRLDMHIQVETEGEAQQIDLTITNDKMTVSGPEGEQEIDLAAAGMSGPMMGFAMRMRMTPQGEIVWFSSEGMERLSQMTGMDLSQMMKPSETPFPDRELAPGDSWEYEMEFPVPGGEDNTQMKMKSNLLSVATDDGRRIARVSLNGDINLSGMTIETPSGPGKPATKVTFDEMKERLAGQFDFDLTRGVMTEATYDIALTTRMKTPPSPQGEPPSTIATDMKMKVELTERK